MKKEGELIAEAVISNNSNMDFISSKNSIVEGNLNKAKKKIKAERLQRSFSTAQVEASSMINLDQLGDYHIYKLNEKHDLGLKKKYYG